MGNELQTYKVVEMTLGNPSLTQRIIFENRDDLEKANKEIDEGRDIYVLKEGIITKILHQKISVKVYNGEILLCAKEGK